MTILKSYREAVAYVESFSNTSLRYNYGKKKRDPSFYISRTKYFLSLLGNPEARPKFVHVTGTAGKGSVSTMIHKALVMSGKNTGLFTSPYVTTTVDQIKVGEKYISPSDFVRIVSKLKPHIEKAKNGPWGGPSAFEILLAIALVYFKERKCEWVVLEVGVGGRYDATNVISNVRAAVITNVDYDHTEILGNTLTKIANDKIGILKNGSTFFTTEQRPHLKRIFKLECKKFGVGCNFIGRQKSSHDYNRELVCTVCSSLGISTQVARVAIESVKLPCRFEIVQKNPMVILDGAHNRAKIRSTVEKAKQIKYEKAFVLTAVASTNRDQLAVIKPLTFLLRFEKMIITRSGTINRLTHDPQRVLSSVRKYLRKSDKIVIQEDSGWALDELLEKASSRGLILVTGSFFLSGHLRKRFVSEEWILRNLTSFKK